MSGCLWLLAGWRFGFSAQTAFAVTFFYLLLILSWIDIDTMRLPNVLVGLLAIIGTVGAVFAQIMGTPVVPLIGLGSMESSPLVVAVLGALVASVPALLLSLILAAVLKRPALGMGDVKLLGVFGIFLGAFGLMALFIGSLVGVVFAVMARARAGSKGPSDPAQGEDSWEPVHEAASDGDRPVGHTVGESDEGDEAEAKFSGDDVFPFGPALAAGAIIVTMVGPQLWSWYQTLFVM